MDTGRDALGIKSLNRHTLEQIVAASPAAVLVANASDPQLPIVYANAAYERLTGFTPRELAGQPWSALARAAGDLARDAHVLVEQQGFKLRTARVFDMFPHTHHIEALALFTRD